MATADVSKNIKKPEPQEVVLFKWNYKGENIDQKWQILTGVFLILCLVLFLIDKNYLGIGIVIIIGFLIFLLSYYKKDQSFAILKNGIKIKNEIFSWDDLESFWMIEEEPLEIYIKHKNNKFLGHIVLPFHKKDTGKIKNILLSYLPEKEKKRRPVDKFFRKIGL